MFTINRLSLAKELSLLQSVAEKRTTIPVLATVLTGFDGSICRLTASDCSVTLQTEIEGQGEPWSGCVPLRQFAALSRLLEGEAVSVAPAPNGRVEVKCGASKHVLPIYEAAAFPQTDEVSAAIEVQVDGEVLRQAIRRILPSVDDHEAQWQLQGVQLELSKDLLRAVATDGHRLGVAEISVINESEVKAIVTGLPALLKMEGDVILRLTANHAQFQCGQRVLTTRLLVGTFPNWEMLIPESPPHSIEFDSAAMQAALRRVAVTREECYKTGTGTILGGVRLDLHADKLRVTTNYNDKGESEEWVTAASDLNGESIPIGINPDYLNDYLTQVDGAVKVGFTDNNVQLLLTSPVAPDYRYIIMTIRL